MVQAFHEKVEDPAGNLANAAVYLMTPEVARFISRLAGPFVDLGGHPRLRRLDPGPLARGYFRDIGSRESLAEAEFRR